MNKLQDEIFIQTKGLTGTVNALRIFLYTLVSSIMLVVVLALFSMLTLPMTLVIIAISFLYSILRDFSITKYSNKQMQKYYDYAVENHDNLELYMPLLEKTFQGYFLKRAALIIENGQLYIEAFRQRKNDKQDQLSIPVKYGEKFVIDRQSVDKNQKSLTLDSTFAGQYYRFSITNNQTAINLIEKTKNGGK
ncbi:MAG: hypothetical protein PF513_07225 [Tenericutes bacterium]|jgi:hypothetical protein|nr:hypothetical protein [Mycoplasmatota bacterium]